MIHPRIFTASILSVALFSSLATAQDLSKYRDFQCGTRLESIAEQIHMDVASAKTIHQRPAMIQTLQWDQLSYANPSANERSLRSMRFDFYNGELFKIIVAYDPVGTDGLTTQDMVDAISGIYGPATNPDRTILVPSASMYEDNQKVLGCWENDQYSYSLFRSRYGNAFGLMVTSKKLDLVATDAIREAERLDKLEAPAKEIARQKQQEADRRTERENARLISKPNFRP
jgi:hypothetical protein